MFIKDHFDESDLPNFEPDGKVGLVATVNSEGLPHITLITAMQAIDTKHLVFGQFCEGRGKRNAEERRKVGFLFLSLDKRVWRGTATWTGKADSGPEHILMNKKPMWRYNSYFGIHTVHYLDLVSTTSAGKIDMGSVLAGVVKAALFGRAPGNVRGHGPGDVRGQAPGSNSGGDFHPDAMNAWTQGFISKTGNLKFASYVGKDGYPRIIPQLAAVAAGGGRIYLPGVEHGEELAEIPEGASVALFTMALSMEDVLVRGRFSRRGSGGIIEIDWVYNSMPPVVEQIYPHHDLSAKVMVFQ